MHEIFDGKFREVNENFLTFSCGSRNLLSLFSSHLAKLEGSLLVFGIWRKKGTLRCFAEVNGANELRQKEGLLTSSKLLLKFIASRRSFVGSFRRRYGIG